MKNTKKAYIPAKAQLFSVKKADIICSSFVGPEDDLLKEEEEQED